LLPGLALLLAACGTQPPLAAAGSTQQAVATQTVATLGLELAKATETQAALATQLSKDSASATAVSGCLAAGGQVELFEQESEYLDAGLRFRVYTPPCYTELPEQRYPVLYLVHGQTYNDDQWDRLGADEAASELIAAGELPPFIIVMPYDISSNQPSLDHFGEAVIEELLPWVDANFRTLADREHRAVGGLSRGASWAIHLALTHPELFAAMGGHSPPVFVEDASQVRGWLDTIPAELMPRIWLDIGERDQQAILSSAIWFEGLLSERNIPHEWSLFAGDHSEAYWSSHVAVYLRWYAREW
jgi:enterochelin esterase-like enzyme